MNDKKLTVKEATLMDDEFKKYLFNYDPSVLEMIIRTVMEEAAEKTNFEIDLSNITVENLNQNDIEFVVNGNYKDESSKPIHFYFSTQDTEASNFWLPIGNSDGEYQIIFSSKGIPGNVEVGDYVLMDQSTKKLLNSEKHQIMINCNHPNFRNEFRKIQLLAQDLMEADTEKIHNEKIKQVYKEINKNENLTEL